MLLLSGTRNEFHLSRVFIGYLSTSSIQLEILEARTKAWTYLIEINTIAGDDLTRKAL
jgi:hypothetical protein